MNDDVVIKRWFVCGMMLVLATWSLTSGLGYLINVGWSIMTVMSFGGVIAWAAYGMYYLMAVSKIESTEDDE